MPSLTKEQRENLWMKKTQNHIRQGKENKLSETTVKTYSQRIRRLWKMMNGYERYKGFNFVKKNINKNIDFINNADIPEGSKKGMFVAILSVYREDDKNKKGLKDYKKQVDKYLEWQKKEDKKQKRDKNQIMKWHTPEEIKEGEEKLLKKAIKSKDMVHWKDYVLYFMFTVAPPRRAIDYGKMKIVDKEESDDFNYLVYEKAKNGKRFKKFVFNEFKLSDKKGSETFSRDYINNLPRGDDIIAMLDDWVNRNTTGWFLLDEKQPNAMTKHVSRVSKKALDVPVNLNVFRHIYISEFLDQSPFLLEKEAVALFMSHSVERQALYRKRVDEMNGGAEELIRGFERGEPKPKGVKNTD